MPPRPYTRCNKCGTLSQKKCCETDPPTRGSAHARGYGVAWRKVRAALLASEPLCRDCHKAGHVTPAAEVHHVQKIRTHPGLAYDEGNLMPLCRKCHETRTKRGE